jgi:hypothetical protein
MCRLGSPEERSTAAAACAPFMPLRGATFEYFAKVRLTRICAHSPNASGTMVHRAQRPMDDMAVSPPEAGFGWCPGAP